MKRRAKIVNTRNSIITSYVKRHGDSTLSHILIGVKDGNCSIGLAENIIKKLFRVKT